LECIHCCKGDSASGCEMAIWGRQLCNLWTNWLNLWHAWPDLVCQISQEAQLMLTNPRDMFRGQWMSPNIVPFHMLGIVSSCAIVTLSLRRTIFPIFDFKNCDDCEIRVRGHSVIASVMRMVNSDCSTSHLRNVQRIGLDDRYRNGDRHCDTSLTVEVVWRQKFTKFWVLNYFCFYLLAKPSLVTFLVAEPANWLYCCLTDWSIVCFK